MIIPGVLPRSTTIPGVCHLLMIDLFGLLLKTVLHLLVSRPMIFDRLELLLLMIAMSGHLPVKFVMLQSQMIVVFDLFLLCNHKTFPRV